MAETRTAPTDAEHERYDRLVAEIERLNKELVRQALPVAKSAMDLLARATVAEAEVEDLREAVAAMGLEVLAAREGRTALERELAASRGLVGRLDEHAKALAVELKTSQRDAKAAVLREIELDVECGVLRAALAEVQGILAPLWPGTVADAVELAELAALVIGPACGRERGEDLVELGVGQPEPAAQTRRSFQLWHLIGAAVGTSIVCGVAAADVVRGWVW